MRFARVCGDARPSEMKIGYDLRLGRGPYFLSQSISTTVLFTIITSMVVTFLSVHWEAIAHIFKCNIYEVAVE